MTQRRSRGTTGTVLACGIILTTGLLAGAASASGPAGASLASSLRLAYTCQFPSGHTQIEAQIGVRLPPTAVTGQPAQPTGARAAITLPHAAAADVTRLGAAFVTGDDQLTTVIEQNGQSAVAAWTGQSSSLVPVPRAGDLTLRTDDSAPAVTVAAPGIVSLAASKLAIVLVLYKAPGDIGNPASLRLTCSVDPGQDTQLGTITVSAGPASSAPGKAAAGIKVSTASGSSGLVSGKVTIPPGCGDIPKKGSGDPSCGYIIGFSNVNKLNGSALLGPGLVNIDFGEAFKYIDHNKYLLETSTGELYYQGQHELPPATATFLSFGFMPVTATLVVTELTPINIVSISGITGSPYPITVTASTEITISLTNIMVNGVPLSVGPSCHTPAFPLVLHGKGQNGPPAKGYTVSTGGPLTGLVDIPDFAGCGSGENIDPLLSGTISGDNNFTLMTQSPLCFPSNPLPPVSVCPPPVPKPLRTVPPL